MWWAITIFVISTIGIWVIHGFLIDGKDIVKLWWLAPIFFGFSSIIARINWFGFGHSLLFGICVYAFILIVQLINGRKRSKGILDEYLVDIGLIDIEDGDARNKLDEVVKSAKENLKNHKKYFAIIDEARDKKIREIRLRECDLEQQALEEAKKLKELRHQLDTDQKNCAKNIKNLLKDI